MLHTENGKIFGLQIEGQIESTERFIELLQFIEGKAKYIEQHDLVLVVPIGFGIASVLSHETYVSKLLDSYPCIRLMIYEDFPNLIDGCKNRLLNHLSTQYRLWLGNLGSGARTNLVAVMEGCFDGLVLDERFTQGNRDKAIFPAVINEVSKYTNTLIVPGINTGRYRSLRLWHIEQLM
ncbi:hypothetical protein [Pantoea sp. RIT-PI-b]|uniref:hypothetical protein n=1 Tax=Pantoea sp. RIT-PI-b TaxID=1681195 RepID=UPI0013791D2E|nr:hypothetical protein [Pantoea sp. RIT-PI-b]